MATKFQEFLGPSADVLARMHTAEAIGALVQILRDDKAKNTDKLTAAQALLDRGHGKAVQATIALPTRRARQAQLTALSDDELLAIAKRGRQEPHDQGEEGGRGQNEGPVAGGRKRGPHQEFFANSRTQGRDEANSRTQGRDSDEANADPDEANAAPGEVHPDLLPEALTDDQFQAKMRSEQAAFTPNPGPKKPFGYEDVVDTDEGDPLA